MGRIKKEGLILLIRSFKKINEEIENKQQIDVEVLTDCQSQAVDLGNYIELLYKDINTSDLIHKLEEYCEFVYQLSLPENCCEMKRILKKTRKLLFAIESDIQYLLPEDKKIIVFLPYKASMWDSLESIYFAAKEDPMCEVYVIPIPYYDKNPDGSFGRNHYEGEDFPENIPITSWQEFSIEENRPDVIFVHNPYDNWNFATSVYPQFYCRELKKHTDELVYVPYFVLHEIKLENRFEVDKIKHFASLPGVIYADKVIVQSEEMKKIYVTEFIAWAEEHKLAGKYTDKAYQDNRILGIGSPKFDKLFSDGAKRIPLQWEAKIGSGEGRKKVIFFNTNVSLILNNGDYFVENLKRIEKIFERYSKEYVVIWREHPLTYESMKSMRPQILEEYLKFKEYFIKKDWVIMDETPEWHQAVAVSDCYYGAGGSLSALYLATKKPIMITDYKYPNGISNKEVTVETMFRMMNKKHYFNEVFSNLLDLFLSKFVQISEHQKKCLEFLPEPDEIKQVCVGKRIYDCCCGQRRGNV
ncbi:glycosyltransferase family protein [Konateibacter massiliensis]|uniref:hypothetical protein n=1 Tax=Konateibacter massiliensis TaxID=2002841 RepID=UPI000C15F1B0|nr:hypothetical protein [Konateibacter massiliensis]